MVKKRSWLIWVVSFIAIVALILAIVAFSKTTITGKGIFWFWKKQSKIVNKPNYECFNTKECYCPQGYTPQQLRCWADVGGTCECSCNKNDGSGATVYGVCGAQVNVNGPG